MFWNKKEVKIVTEILPDVGFDFKAVDVISIERNNNNTHTCICFYGRGNGIEELFINCTVVQHNKLVKEFKEATKVSK